MAVVLYDTKTNWIIVVKSKYTIQDKVSAMLYDTKTNLMRVIFN